MFSSGSKEGLGLRRELTERKVIKKALRCLGLCGVGNPTTYGGYG